MFGPRCFFPNIVNNVSIPVNPHLDQLQPYPFEKLRQLFAQVTANAQFKAISLGMGEPKHPTPPFIAQALIDNIKGLATYPTTIGTEAVSYTHLTLPTSDLV